ncbi:MAG: hypothetical protein AMJ46_01875 [Latescibacteria bacterium DG_63]|nr:MAG: hypothetical protein AMJ46_01875 [Latescibacteria bacterium DG_63]
MRFHIRTLRSWKTLAILSALVVGSLSTQGEPSGLPTPTWRLPDGRGVNLPDSSNTTLRIAQTLTDDIPPAVVRDLASTPVDVRTYPRGFFIPAYFTLDQTATQILNERFHLIIVGRNSDYLGIDPDKTTVMAGPALLFSNSRGRQDEWNEIDAHEDWFFHSSSEMSPETRIPLSGYPHLFYMNVGSEGWRGFVVSKYGEVVTNNPAVKGVFVDGILAPSEYAAELGTAFPNYDSSTYQAKILEFIAGIRNGVEGKLVILNSELFKPFTLAADGGLAEGFVHFGGRRNDEHISKTRWLENIETIADRDFDDKYLLVGSGSLETTLPSMLEYCYASFLIGYSANARCYFYWHSNAEGGYSTINWFPLWELDIGEPRGSYFESDGIYKRDFSEGVVLVNPNDIGEPITVSLDETYVDSSGNTVTSMTLPNKSGAVLRKEQ